jgi:hypothetical protein
MRYSYSSLSVLLWPCLKILVYGKNASKMPIRVSDITIV